jgi:hypothetical protein
MKTAWVLLKYCGKKHYPLALNQAKNTLIYIEETAKDYKYGTYNIQWGRNSNVGNIEFIDWCIEQFGEDIKDEALALEQKLNDEDNPVFAANEIEEREKLITDILFELMCVCYHKSIEFKYYSPQAIKKQQEQSTFKHKDDVIQKINIYKYEGAPNLDINIENYDNYSDENSVYVNGGHWEGYEYSSTEFYNDFKERLGGVELDNVFDIGYNDSCIVNQRTYRDFQKNIKLDYGVKSHLVEAIVYYRQAFLLKQRIINSKLFNCSNELIISTFIHGSLDSIDVDFWEYIENTMHKKISEVFTEIGLIN